MNLSNEAFDELLTAFIEAEATEDQLRELSEAVRSSSELRQRFQQETRLNTLLHETVSEQIELHAIQEHGVVIPTNSETTTWSNGWAVLAATLLFVASTAWFIQSRSNTTPDQSMGTCMSLTGNGDLSIQRGDQQQSATQGLTLVQGDRVICGADTRAMLRLNDGSILAMEPRAELTLVSGRPQIQLNRGEVLFEVAKRESGSAPFQVQTLESTVDVLGTVFALSSSEHTELEVYEGEVTLTRLRDQAQVNVASLQRATTANQDLAVEDLSASPSSSSVKILALVPTDDVTLIRGRPENDAFLKVEGKRRVVFMRFEIPDGINIRSARLRLVQSVDTGSGILSVHTGDHSEWNEDEIKATNAPKMTRLVATHAGVVGRGQVVELNIAGPIQPGPLTLILSLDRKGEDDIWFSSNESETPPQLLLTLAGERE